MFNLSTAYGNTLNLADCVQNSLETESPFISFYSQKQDYHVSYYLDDKSLRTDYYGDDPDMENLVSLYWEGLDIGGSKIARALESHEPVTDFHLMQADYITAAAAVILHVMDDFSILAENLIG